MATLAREQVRLRYAPGLDGVRALAVTGVVLFHAGLGWAAGGFIGVSVFFTLSGFLIGSLLIAEATGSEAVNLRRFWSRRIRRLVPGAVVTTALGVAVAAFALPSARAAVRGDVIAVLTYIANWHFWQSGRSYSALFVSPSPLLHFWSLAIEEQLNVVLPLIVIAAMRWGRRSQSGRRRLGAIVAIAWVIFTTFAVVAGATGHRDFAYYSTFTRAPEFLTGMLVASLMLARPKKPKHRYDIIGASGLGALVGIAATISTTTGWLYRGGFVAISFASVALVVAATQPFGLLADVLSWKPLRLLGKISYGIYLYHWPIFLVLSPARTHLATAPLTLLRVAITVMVAALSYVFIESPITSGRRFRRPRSALLATGGIVTTVTAAVLISTVPNAGAAIDFEHFRQQLARGPIANALGASANSGLDAAQLSQGPARSTTSVARAAPIMTAQAALEPDVVTSQAKKPDATSETTAAATPPKPTKPAPIHVGMFGDSTGVMTSMGLLDWGQATGRIDVGGKAALGCPVVRGGQVNYLGTAGPVKSGCDWSKNWPAYLDSYPVDVAVIQFGPWDVSDRQLDGESVWRHPGDAVYDRKLADEITGATRLLTARGIPVIWLSSPMLHLDRMKREDPTAVTSFRTAEPDRMRRFNEVMRDAVSKIPNATVYDLAGKLAELPGGNDEDARLRPDGVHFSRTMTSEVATWLAPALIDVYRPMVARPDLRGVH